MREQLASIWKNLEEYICCALLGVIMTLLMMQVCYRYFGGKSIAWSEEVSRFLFLYLVYFAASLAASKNLHIRVTAQLKQSSTSCRSSARCFCSLRRTSSG